MYSPVPAAAHAWTRLFAHLSRVAGLDIVPIEHPAPRPLFQLWDRDDMAAMFMCGLPFAAEARAHGPRPILAAPVPLSEGAAVYRTHFVVRTDAPWRTLRDSFGHRLGWTVADSHSGRIAPFRHLLTRHGSRPDRLYAELVGPLVHPRGVVEAVRDGRVDVGPVDSLAFDLMCRHAPDLVASVRVLDSTDAAPVPLLVASRAAPAALARSLAAALVDPGSWAGSDDLLTDVCIRGFAPSQPSDYAINLAWADAVATSERDGVSG